MKSNRPAFGGLEEKGFSWPHCPLHLASFNKLSKKKIPSPRRPLQQMSDSTHAVKKE